MKRYEFGKNIKGAFNVDVFDSYNQKLHECMVVVGENQEGFTLTPLLRRQARSHQVNAIVAITAMIKVATYLEEKDFIRKINCIWTYEELSPWVGHWKTETTKQKILPGVVLFDVGEDVYVNSNGNVLPWNEAVNASKLLSFDQDQLTGWWNGRFKDHSVTNFQVVYDDLKE